MSAQIVADQQVLAAWVSAGAAVVQAVGALAAIGVSIWLAQSSAKRERAADEAAERRIAAADQAAEARIAKSKIDAHNELIDRIGALGALARDEITGLITSQKAGHDGSRATFIGAFGGTRMDELREALPSIRNEAATVTLLGAISALQDAAFPRTVQGEGNAAYIAAFIGLLEKFEAALAAVEALRK